MKFNSTLALLLFGFISQAQQLYFEGFGTYNRTSYSCPTPAIILCNVDKYFGVGGRLAGGMDYLQIGTEYRTNLSNPTFATSDRDTIASFSESYLGAFIRTKISRYPAMRFGLVLRAGAGFYNSTSNLEIQSVKSSKKYRSILGYNGGIGVSIPAFHRTMVELGYTFNYLRRPDGLAEIPEHRAAYHMFSAGISLNLVFGKKAEQYERTRKTWKYHKGWQDESKD